MCYSHNTYMRSQPRTIADRPREPEHLRRIKAQKASWDEADIAKRNARLADWFKKVAKLPPDSPARILATHNRAHVDEVVMMWLGAKYPSAPFGNISHVIRLDQIEDEERPFGEGVIIRTKMGPYKGLDSLANWREGVRLLGTGGGVLDEHVAPGEPRVENESGATLIARLLGVIEKDELTRLLNAVRLHDTTGSRPAVIDKLVSSIKEGYREIDWDIPIGSPEDKAHQIKVIRKGLILLNRFSERELRILEEYRKKASIWATDSRKDIAIGSIRSDSPFMIDYIREKDHTSAVIQKRASGHVIILLDKSKIPGEVANYLASAIREEEGHLQRRPVPRVRRDLIGEGTVECAPEWYYVHGNLLNGSESYPNTPATSIPLSRIEDIVTEVFAARADRIREWRKEKKGERQQHFKNQARERN